MELRATKAQLSQDYASGDMQITFTCSDAYQAKAAYEKLKDMTDIKLTYAKYRKNRSLNANSYAWALITQMADVLGSSKEEIYEQMLNRYGTLATDENGSPITITARVGIDISSLPGHWYPYEVSSDGRFRAFLQIKGSSEYDTKEMSRLLNGIVSECRDMDIITLEDLDISRLVDTWKTKEI